MKAVILAGGKGTRLLPYTKVLPKPMMPIGDKPIVEIIMDQLSSYGFHEIIMAVGHLSNVIRRHFKGKYSNGVRLSYLEEEKPLGTAGCLALLPKPEEETLVMNGDILTSLNYAELMDYHRKKEAALTIAVSSKNVQLEFGIVRVDSNHQVIGYDEKPALPCDVSTGVYVYSPRVWNFLQPHHHLDFPALVKKLLQEGETISAYPYQGYWKDIGTHEEYETAVQDFEEKKEIFSPQKKLLISHELV